MVVIDNKNKRISKDNPLKVLLVEDNPAHAELIMRSLEDHEIHNKIYHISDGEAALDFIFNREPYEDKEEFPRPHIILLDLRLPRIGGLEVLREIKATEDTKKIPVIILTTSKAEIDVNTAYEHYANSYLVKPVDFDEFIKLMNDLGYYW